MRVGLVSRSLLAFKELTGGAYGRNKRLDLECRVLEAAVRAVQDDDAQLSVANLGLET